MTKVQISFHIFPKRTHKKVLTTSALIVIIYIHSFLVKHVYLINHIVCTGIDEQGVLQQEYSLPKYCPFATFWWVVNQEITFLLCYHLGVKYGNESLIQLRSKN